MPRSRTQFYPLMEGEPGAAGGGAAAAAATKPEPEVFSREYVTELRGENATYQTKAKDAESKREAAEAAAKKAAEDAENKVKEAQKAADDRIIRAELKAAALKAGMVDLDGLKLADLSKVKLNDKGEIEGADVLMEELKKSKPYLFKETSSSSSTGKTPKPDDKSGKKDAKDMTDEEWKAERKRRGF